MEVCLPRTMEWPFPSEFCIQKCKAGAAARGQGRSGMANAFGNETSHSECAPSFENWTPFQNELYPKMGVAPSRLRDGVQSSYSHFGKAMSIP
jgi:hypothetical protein